MVVVKKLSLRFLLAASCLLRGVFLFAVEVPLSIPTVSASQQPDAVDADYLTELAQVHVRHGHPDKAEALYRAITEKEQNVSKKIAACEALSALLLKRGAAKDAAKELQAATDSARNLLERGRLTMALADCLIKGGMFAEAENVLLDAAGSDSSLPGGAWLKASALGMLEDGWRKNPERLKAFVAETEAKIKQNPASTTLLEQLAAVYEKNQRDPAKAAELLERLVVLQPKNRAQQLRLAALYSQSKQFDKAVDLAKKMFASPDLSPDEAKFERYRIAMLLIEAGRKEEALAWIKEKFHGDPSDSKEQISIGALYQQAGLATESEAAFSHAFESAKDPEEKTNAKLKLVELALSQNDLEKADARARAIITEMKDTPAAQSRALMLLQQIAAQKFELRKAKAKTSDSITSEKQILVLDKKN